MTQIGAENLFSAAFKAEQEAKKAEKLAQTATEAKSNFLANMSHEIRTPINTIMGMDEMILRETSEKQVEEYALDIKTASQNLLSLINDILDITKIESGKMNLVETEYDTQEQIRSVVTMIRARNNQKGLQFDLDIDNDIPKKLCGDYGKIKQIVLNLLTNAFKYTEKGGFKLTIKVLCKEGTKCKLLFSVKDTGIGIKIEDKDRLFSPFERMDESKNSGIQGTGLGLAISKQFAELMGGKLWLESEYGKGSTFFFEVEQKILEEEVIGVFEEQADIQVRGPYIPLFVAPNAKVLVVDDNRMNLNVIVGLLKVTGMQVFTAESGEECLKILREQEVDIILLDHMMPQMDGIETLKQIRQVGLTTPVVALTANYSNDADEVYASYGFDGYLPKPVDGRLMETIISKLIPSDLVEFQEDLYYTGTQKEDVPENMKWLLDVEEIDVDEGIRNSGGVMPFIYSLKFFYETIEDGIATLENALNNDDISLFTIKVHALKSSGRLIGAIKLSNMAKDLETAGKSNDAEFIKSNYGALIKEYRAFNDRLSKIRETDLEKDVTVKTATITSDELDATYKALAEYAGLMDVDAIEQILAKIKEYRLPDRDEKIMGDIKTALQKYDWDTIRRLSIDPILIYTQSQKQIKLFVTQNNARISVLIDLELQKF